MHVNLYLILLQKYFEVQKTVSFILYQRKNHDNYDYCRNENIRIFVQYIPISFININIVSRGSRQLISIS